MGRSVSGVFGAGILHCDRLLEDYATGRALTSSPSSVDLSRRVLYRFGFRYGMRIALIADDVAGPRLRVASFGHLEGHMSVAVDTAC